VLGAGRLKRADSTDAPCCDCEGGEPCCLLFVVCVDGGPCCWLTGACDVGGAWFLSDGGGWLVGGCGGGGGGGAGCWTYVSGRPDVNKDCDWGFVGCWFSCPCCGG
jgi:hypothetical protein